MCCQVLFFYGLIAPSILMKEIIKRNIAVFCGSNTGNKPDYRESCMLLAHELYKHNIGLVYGGGNVGLMGILADTLLNLGGEVTGVIPKKFVDIEVAHAGLTQMHIVSGMHERKALMTKLSDAFIVMPGGIGTLEEFFEVFTWLQLGYHHKPVGLLNISEFYTTLIQFLKQIADEGFVTKSQLNQLFVEERPANLIALLLKKI
jgi:uncharacterized protein (TIGR00730 family)